MNARWLATAMIALAACGGGTPAPAPQTPAPAATAAHIVRVRHLPPTAKDVIDAAIESGTVPLSVSATCTSVGTEPTDATIGRYLAGFLAELSSPDKKNWIETKIDTGWSRAGDPVSICTLVIRHEDGDDRWGWGVRFQIRSTDGLVLNDSFTCVGAG